MQAAGCWNCCVSPWRARAGCARAFTVYLPVHRRPQLRPQQRRRPTPRPFHIGLRPAPQAVGTASPPLVAFPSFLGPSTLKWTGAAPFLHAIHRVAPCIDCSHCLSALVPFRAFLISERPGRVLSVRGRGVPALGPVSPLHPMKRKSPLGSVSSRVGECSLRRGRQRSGI